ncbi:MAG: TolC family protein [Dysgonamonadaceae bacterium]|jgi:outer membrane protein TolC|nr:TolC family protein [Dysgonamonadaceae bacterium]
MKKRFSIIFQTTIFIFSSFVSIPAFTQEILDLKHCLEIGLKQNYDIRIIRNEQKISDNNYTVGNAGYLPTIDLSAGYSGTSNNIEQKTATGETVKNNGIDNRTLNAGVNLSWTVFDGFQIQAKYEKLKELKQMGELNTRLAIEDFISGLTSEYYNYVRQNIRLANLKYAVSLSKERVRIVEARYNIGSMSRLDLQQARVDFNADSSNLIKQQEILYSSRITLNQLMALDNISQMLIVADSIIIPNSTLKEVDLCEKTMLYNSLLLVSEKNKRVSELDYKAVKGRNFPYLRVNAGYGYTQNVYEMGTYDRQKTMGLNYGITLGFNIFDGFNRKREQKNAALQIQNRELQYEQMELGLKANLANIWMAYENNLELLSLEKENLETARENYDIAIERYKLGELSGIELREAQNSLLEAEERLLLASYNTKLCEISLMQISGQITEYLE